MTDLPPKELDLFRHVETPKTLPKGNERLIGDAQCSPAIAKGAAWLQLQSPTQFSGVVEEVVESIVMFPSEIPWVPIQIDKGATAVYP